MVILVDEEIYSCIGLTRFPVEMVKLFHATILLVHFFFYALRQILLIDIAEIIKFSVTNCIQRTAVIAQVGIYYCKV